MLTHLAHPTSYSELHFEFEPALTRQTVYRIFADRAEAMRIAVQWQPAAKAKALSTAAN